MRAKIKMVIVWLENTAKTVDGDWIGHGNSSEINGEQNWEV